MNILVTGANGQLGASIRALSGLHRQHSCFFTDIGELDITDRKAVELFAGKNNIDLIVNCAAYTAVDKAEDERDAANLINNIAPGNLAQVMQSRGGSMVCISTDYVFDGKAASPYKEDDEASPRTVYGATKLAGERNVLDNCRKALVIRTSWLYSEHGDNFVKKMIHLGKERKVIHVVADQMGTPTYAGDLAETLFAVIGKGFDRGIYHYSNEGVCSWYDFARAIHRLAGITACEINPVSTAEYPAKAVRPAYSALDTIKIKTTYNIEIPHWEDSLALCIGKINRAGTL